MEARVETELHPCDRSDTWDVLCPAAFRLAKVGRVISNPRQQMMSEETHKIKFSLLVTHGW